MTRFAAPDGTMLHYTDEGAGLPVICLAGLTRDGRDFDFVAPHLGDVRLIRLDYRGRGRSDWADPATYQIPVEAQDTVALMDHLGLAKAAILGTSRGGLIAMVLAATAKDRLLGVALNDIGPEIAQAGLDFIADYLGVPTSLKTHEAVAARRKAAMTGFRDVPDSRWLEEAQRLFHRTEEGLALTYDPALREAVLGGGAQPVPDLWPLFDALEGLPLCALHGENSDLLTPQTFTEMARRRPDMVAVTVRDRGHIPFLDEPEAVAGLRRWLDLMR